MNVISDYPPVNSQEWDCQCARCGSTADFQRCEECEDGYSGHDCGEDCCVCLYPEENVICDICRGHGGWYQCMSSLEFCTYNPMRGRENTERGLIEWFPVDFILR